MSQPVDVNNLLNAGQVMRWANQAFARALSDEDRAFVMTAVNDWRPSPDMVAPVLIAEADWNRLHDLSGAQ